MSNFLPPGCSGPAEETRASGHSAVEFFSASCLSFPSIVSPFLSHPRFQAGWSVCRKRVRGDNVCSRLVPRALLACSSLLAPGERLKRGQVHLLAVSQARRTVTRTFSLAENDLRGMYANGQGFWRHRCVSTNPQVSTVRHACATNHVHVSVSTCPCPGP